MGGKRARAHQDPDARPEHAEEEDFPPSSLFVRRSPQLRLVLADLPDEGDLRGRAVKQDAHEEDQGEDV